MTCVFMNNITLLLIKLKLNFVTYTEMIRTFLLYKTFKRIRFKTTGMRVHYDLRKERQRSRFPTSVSSQFPTFPYNTKTSFLTHARADTCVIVKYIQYQRQLNLNKICGLLLYFIDLVKVLQICFRQM